MKILVLGGFLGSGKTSQLIRLAEYVIGHDENIDGAKVVILENEIGEVGVDDTVLTAGGLTVRNLFAGCICCSLSGELIPTLRKLDDEFGPELVIIEATGVACPAQIKDTLVQVIPGSDIRICTIVDAKRWDRIKVPLGHLLENQLVGADTVLVNKIDLVDEDKPAQIIEELREINPEPRFFTASAMAESDPAVWRAVLREEE